MEQPPLLLKFNGWRVIGGSIQVPHGEEAVRVDTVSNELGQVLALIPDDPDRRLMVSQDGELFYEQAVRAMSEGHPRD
jgi:hypothetical protein